MMLVTVNTDASYCPETGAAGWSCFVASDRGAVAKSGNFKHYIKNSSCAERKAIGLALYYGLKEGVIKKGDTVILQSDCIPALDYCIVKCKVCLNYKDRFDLNYISKHVKGHTGNRNGRFLSNHINDCRAKLAMRRQRKAIKLKEAYKNAKKRSN